MGDIRVDTELDEMLDKVAVPENGSGPEESPVPAEEGMSLRDRIFAADDERSERVPIKEWGVTIEVRSMTGARRAACIQKYFDQDTGMLDFERMTPEIIIETSFDPETGEKVFQPGDGPMLSQKSAGPLEMLGQAALRISGLDQRAREAAGKGS